MSLKEATFSACRSLKDSPVREELSSAVINTNFSGFGQAVRTLGLQFFGVLLVDQNRHAYEIKLETVPPEMIALFAFAHQSIVELNQECVRPIVEAIGNAHLAIDPYSEFILEKQIPVSDQRIFDPDSTFNLLTQFHLHPAISVAIDSFNTCNEIVTAEHFYNDVIRYRNQLTEHGPMHEPEWLDSYQRSSGAGPERMHNRLMLALLCIRESLRNMDQLLFQSAIFDKLIKFDSNNLIDLSSTYSNGSGSCLGIVFHNGNFDVLHSMTFNSLNRIVLIEGAYGTDGNRLARVESYSGSLGVSNAPNYAELRLLDDNLNPFPGLLR